MCGRGGGWLIEGADSAAIATEDAGKGMGPGEHEIDTSGRMLFKH
jgi:hypothetical protein